MPNQISNKPEKCLNREHMGNHLVKVTQDILRFVGVVTSGEGFTLITKNTGEVVSSTLKIKIDRIKVGSVLGKIT